MRKANYKRCGSRLWRDAACSSCSRRNRISRLSLETAVLSVTAAWLGASYGADAERAEDGGHPLLTYCRPTSIRVIKWFDMTSYECSTPQDGIRSFGNSAMTMLMAVPLSEQYADLLSRLLAGGTCRGRHQSGESDYGLRHAPIRCVMVPQPNPGDTPLLLATRLPPLHRHLFPPPISLSPVLTCS